MDQPDASRTIVVTNRQGFHLRAAQLFSHLARQFQCQITVSKGSHYVDGKSTPLHLVSLGAWKGDEVLLQASGSDAEAAVDALADLCASNFHEDEEDRREPTRESRAGEDLLEEGHASG